MVIGLFLDQYRVGLEMIRSFVGLRMVRSFLGRVSDRSDFFLDWSRMVSCRCIFGLNFVKSAFFRSRLILDRLIYVFFCVRSKICLLYRNAHYGERKEFFLLLSPFISSPFLSHTNLICKYWSTFPRFVVWKWR